MEDNVDAEDAAWRVLVTESPRKAHHYAAHRDSRSATTELTVVRTGITGCMGALVSVLVVLTAAIVCAGSARADPSQQDQFVALLEQEQIPPVDDGEVAGVVARAHQLCGELDAGNSVDALIDEEMNRGYQENPRLHLFADRVRRTAIRFVTASVKVYCPRHQGELPPYE